jgi:hypothetical protein
MLVGAEIEYGGVGIEHLLRAIAVVHIPVDNEHAFHPMFLLHIPRRNGYLIEQTKAHGALGEGVMPRWADGSKGVPCPSCHHRIHGCQHSPDGRECDVITLC